MVKYPLFRYAKSHNLIVMFTALNTGEVIQQGTYYHINGYISNTFTQHEDTNIWTPCEDPRLSQRINKMLKHIKDI